ncbi:MAG: hypothetical protein RIS48_671, partial [Pseudomonadota bacterium]
LIFFLPPWTGPDRMSDKAGANAQLTRTGCQQSYPQKSGAATRTKRHPLSGSDEWLMLAT